MAGTKQKSKKQYVVKSVNFKSGEDDDLINYFSARPDVIFSDFIKSLIREKAFSANSSPIGVLDSVIAQLNSMRDMIPNQNEVSIEKVVKITQSKAEKVDKQAENPPGKPIEPIYMDDLIELPDPVPVKKPIAIQAPVADQDSHPKEEMAKDSAAPDMLFDMTRMQPYYLAADGSRVYPMIVTNQPAVDVQGVLKQSSISHSDIEKAKPSVEDVSRMTSDEDAEVMSDIFDVITGGGTG